MTTPPDYRCRVGYLTDPRPDDPYAATVEDALFAALDKSMQDQDAILAVWAVDDGRLLCIVYEGEAFWP